MRLRNWLVWILAVLVWHFVPTQSETTPADSSPAEVAPIEQRNLFMHIAALKDSYYYGESVQITYWIDNTGTEAELYRTEEIDRLDIRTISGFAVSGCRLTWTGTPIMKQNQDGTLSHTDWLALGSGQHLAREPSDLLYDGYRDKRFKCDDLAPGAYLISGHRLRSDTIRIDIIDPDGTAEEDAFQSFQQAMQFDYRHARYERAGVYSRLAEFARKYPKSVYVPRALGQLLSADSLLARDAAGHLISEYPQYNYCAKAVFLIDPGDITDRDQRRKVMNGLRIVAATFSDMERVRIKSESLIEELQEQQ